ncbi:putative alpha/beta hydrolase-1, peptidase S33 [Septoria linicola]|nr:putative alpha/beta hydrolase-1, peptidase S33 [Septoria linicola]
MSSIAVSPAKLVSERTHQVAGKLSVTEHFFDVPKDYSKPDNGTLRIFGRSIRKHENPIIPRSQAEQQKASQLPWMVYLNGGPGLFCRPPHHYAFTQRILDAGYQLFFLDQRGTGLSTPITASTLGLRGDSHTQHQYLKLFRADSIVRDCEAIRQTLTSSYPPENKTWSTIGQSFGGFCTITYLSFYPQGLRESFLFGGLQPLVHTPDEVYSQLYHKVICRNEAYYSKYPEDIVRVKSILSFLTRFGADGTIKLPSEGGSLTRRRFLAMGIALGMHGGLDSVHEIVQKASNDIELFGHLTRGSLSTIEASTPFDDHMLYAILHEPIYCSGPGKGGPKWSAERMKKEFREFDDVEDADGKERPAYFTGEMVYPWMFEDYGELRKVQDVANLIAEDDDWPALFDEEQLAKNKVPVYAASYVEDMYVDFELATKTAKKIKGAKVFTTNVMFHDAIRSRMDEVVKQALALRDDVLD